MTDSLRKKAGLLKMNLLRVCIPAIFLAIIFPVDAVFLASISSALAGIPGVLAAIPVAKVLSVAGIIGLKLAIATKLLWFLGYYSSYSRGSHSVEFYANSDYEGGKNLGYPGIAVGGYPPLPPAPVEYGQENQLYGSHRRRRSTEPAVLDSRAETYFRYLSQLDSNSCVSRLACEATAEPRNFGYYGQTIARYLKSIENVGQNSAAFPYVIASRLGKLDSGECVKSFSECTYDLKTILKLLP